MATALDERLVGRPVRILVVDDEETLRFVVGEALRREGYNVVTASSAEEALEAFGQERFPLVITDLIMGGQSGIELLHQLRRMDPSVHVVIMTSSASIDTAMAALRLGAHDYLTKPFEDLEIISSVARRAISSIQLIEENAYLLEALKGRTRELEQANRSLQDAANRDGLTGLYNRRFLREAISMELARAHRYHRSFSIVMADIDHFKEFNDTYGHPAGDAALRFVAELMISLLRRESVLARYGGEEFLLLIPEVDREGARALAERVRQRVTETPVPSERESCVARLTMSLGIATYPEDGTDADALIEHADRALYDAKRAGRDRVCG